MTDVLGRAVGFFVAPAAEQEAAAAATPASSAAAAATPATSAAAPVDRFVAVLGASRDALALAAASALDLRRDTGAPTACVAVWSREPEVGAAAAGAATPAAARAAARLVAHGFAATARGRLVWIDLPADPEPAAAAWERLAGRAGIPVVLALAGARPSELDRVLCEQEAIVLALAADADPALRELAVAGVAALGARVELAPPLSPVLQALALAGVWRVRAAAPAQREGA